jgi:acyl carrier protein
MSVDHILTVITTVIRDLIPDYRGEITLASDFEEIGVDSLSRVDLVVAMERQFDVVISDSVLAGLVTVQDLASFVAGATTAGSAAK